eukprot:6214096-Pleurochrysis_carterae.AAC.1
MPRALWTQRRGAPTHSTHPPHPLALRPRARCGTAVLPTKKQFALQSEMQFVRPFSPFRRAVRMCLGGRSRTRVYACMRVHVCVRRAGGRVEGARSGEAVRIKREGCTQRHETARRTASAPLYWAPSDLSHATPVGVCA